MTLDGPRLKSLHRDLGQLLPCLDITDLKPEKTIDVDVATGVAAIHGQRTNALRERANLPDYLVGRWICHQQIVVVQPGLAIKNLSG